MQLGQRDKELAAIGCRHRLQLPALHRAPHPGGPRGRAVRSELVDAVAIARAVRDDAIESLASRIDELLGGGSAPGGSALVAETSRARTLVALGASVGANSHQLLKRYIAGAAELRLGPREITAAVKMAGYVQNRASEMTTTAATHALDELRGVAVGAAGRS